MNVLNLAHPKASMSNASGQSAGFWGGEWQSGLALYKELAPNYWNVVNETIEGKGTFDVPLKIGAQKTTLMLVQLESAKALQVSIKIETKQ